MLHITRNRGSGEGLHTGIWPGFHAPRHDASLAMDGLPQLTELSLIALSKTRLAARQCQRLFYSGSPSAYQMDYLIHLLRIDPKRLASSCRQ
jgi:hypothetical protein